MVPQGPGIISVKSLDWDKAGRRMRLRISGSGIMQMGPVTILWPDENAKCPPFRLHRDCCPSQFLDLNFQRHGSMKISTFSFLISLLFLPKVELPSVDRSTPPIQSLSEVPLLCVLGGYDGRVGHMMTFVIEAEFESPKLKVLDQGCWYQINLDRSLSAEETSVTPRRTST